MNEILRLADGNEFDLVPNGIKTISTGLAIEIVKPDGMTLEGIRAVFGNKEATAELKVVKEETTLRIETGYTHLGSRMMVDENAAVGVKVTENEDGTSTSETMYASVVRLELQKETLEDKVEANRADIDYLLMMEEK